MFSDKNYGIPKDLIEAAKRVHEKQLMEYNEEVQFTEEELAEAFAIFLEENFHVDMLTEEDLDYVFEEEFPQWLEEVFGRPGAGNQALDKAKREFLAKTANTSAERQAQERNRKALHKKLDRDEKRGASKEMERLDPRAEEDPTGDGSGVAVSSNRIAAKIKSASKPSTTPQKPQPRRVASARKPAPKPQSFGARLRKVGGNAPATSATAAGRRKIKLLDARARARTAAKDAIVRKTGRGQLSWAKKAFNPDGN